MDPATIKIAMKLKDKPIFRWVLFAIMGVAFLINLIWFMFFMTLYQAIGSVFTSNTGMSGLSYTSGIIEMMEMFKAAEEEYDIPWKILAAISKVNTNYGTNSAKNNGKGFMGIPDHIWDEYKTKSNYVPPDQEDDDHHDSDHDSDPDINDPADSIWTVANFLDSMDFDLNNTKLAQTILTQYLGSRQLAIDVLNVYKTIPDLTEGSLGWPLPPDCTNITCPFGERIHPITKKRSFHEGIDLGAPFGTPVYSVFPGVVVSAGKTTVYGNMITIDHGNGLISRYAHLQAMFARVGDSVGAGQQIGEVGSTGWSTGPHLHFETRSNGVAINPMTYLLLPGSEPPQPDEE